MPAQVEIPYRPSRTWHSPAPLADGARIIAKGIGGWILEAAEQLQRWFSPLLVAGSRLAHNSAHQGLGNHTLHTQRLDAKVGEALLFKDAVLLGTSSMWTHDDRLAYTGSDYWPGCTGSDCSVYRVPSWGDRPS